MNNKMLVKTLRMRVAALKAEETDKYTRSLGKAAVKCVHETRKAVEAELARELRPA